MYNKQNPRSPFLKEYVKIMQTLQDKWQKILKPYVLLPYRGTQNHICTFPYVLFSTRKTYSGNQALDYPSFSHNLTSDLPWISYVPANAGQNKKQNSCDNLKQQNPLTDCAFGIQTHFLCCKL